MIALMTTDGHAIALEPDLIESVEQISEDAAVCIVRTSSGKEHSIERSYMYVTRVIKAHYAPH
jgi:uncharacterized protein YlzI (FlbEa/FlbD family)